MYPHSVYRSVLIKLLSSNNLFSIQVGSRPQQAGTLQIKFIISGTNPDWLHEVYCKKPQYMNDVPCGF